MTDHAASGTQAVDRVLGLLSAIGLDGGASSIGMLARRQGLPLSTAHRMIARMEAEGWVVRVERGHYRAGLRLARMAGLAEPRVTAMAVARPLLRKLVRRTGRTAHLGVLEADMVTYLVKEAPARGQMFTREAMQLEAYCSAIGKMLLAGLPEAAREAYLRQGGFVALTPRTIVRQEALRAHLAQVAAQGFALDEEEAATGLYCVAVPVPAVSALPAMAVSVSGTPPDAGAVAGILALARGTAAAFADRLSGAGDASRNRSRSQGRARG